MKTPVRVRFAAMEEGAAGGFFTRKSGARLRGGRGPKIFLTGKIRHRAEFSEGKTRADVFARCAAWRNSARTRATRRSGKRGWNHRGTRSAGFSKAGAKTRAISRLARNDGVTEERLPVAARCERRLSAVMDRRYSGCPACARQRRASAVAEPMADKPARLSAP
jgi:hypothetical protein